MPAKGTAWPELQEAAAVAEVGQNGTAVKGPIP
jgi:hypothetical protein